MSDGIEIQWVARLDATGREAIEAALAGMDHEGALCTTCLVHAGRPSQEVRATTFLAFDDSTECEDILVFCHPCYEGFRKGDCFFDIAAVVHLPADAEPEEAVGRVKCDMCDGDGYYPADPIQACCDCDGLGNTGTPDHLQDCNECKGTGCVLEACDKCDGAGTVAAEGAKED